MADTTTTADQRLAFSVLAAEASSLAASIAETHARTQEAVAWWQSLSSRRRRRLALTTPMLGQRPYGPVTHVELRELRKLYKSAQSRQAFRAPDVRRAALRTSQGRVDTSPRLLASILVTAPGAPSPAA